MRPTSSLRARRRTSQAAALRLRRSVQRPRDASVTRRTDRRTLLQAGQTSLVLRVRRQEPEAIDEALKLIVDKSVKAEERLLLVRAFGEVSEPRAYPRCLRSREARLIWICARRPWRRSPDTTMPPWAPRLPPLTRNFRSRSKSPHKVFLPAGLIGPWPFCD